MLLNILQKAHVHVSKNVFFFRIAAKFIIQLTSICFVCVFSVTFKKSAQPLVFSVGEHALISARLLVKGQANFSWINPQNLTIASGLPSPAVHLSNFSASNQGIYTCLAEFVPGYNRSIRWVTSTKISIGQYLRLCLIPVLSLSDFVGTQIQ